MGSLSDLRAAHPRLFAGPMWEEVPPGWFDLVNTLCREIEALLGPEPERFVIKEIKAKYGELRFYYSLEGAEDTFVDVRTDGNVRTVIGRGDGPPLMDQIRPLVEAASLRSTATCQDCGAPGVRATRGAWVGTLCEEHALEWERQRESDR